MRNPSPQHASQRPSLLTLEILFRILLTGSLLASLAGCSGTSTGGNNTTSLTPSITALSVQSAGVYTATVAQNASVTLVATVDALSAGVTSGTITFSDGTTSIGTAALTANATATLTTTFATTGTHNLTASFPASSTLAASTSPIFTLSVVTASTSTPIIGGASTLYVTQSPSTGQNSILQFPTTGTGNLTPTSTLLPPSSLFVDSVATDATGNIYVGGTTGAYFTPEILVYAPGATGAATPTRTITELGTTPCVPQGMTVDLAGNIYITDDNQNCIAVFAPTANGASTPTRLITGLLTQLDDAEFIAVDAIGDIYVDTINATTGASAILEFAPSATGNVAPIRTITGPASTTTTATIFGGLTLDPANNIYVVQDTATFTGQNVTAITGAIVEFAANATGAATPLKSIAGAQTGIQEGGGLRLDSAGNLFLVNYNITNYTTFTGTTSVLAFPPTATGNVAPPVNFTSTAWSAGGTSIALH